MLSCLLSVGCVVVRRYFPVPARKGRADKLILTVRRGGPDKKVLLDAAQFLFQDLIRVAKHQPVAGAKPYEVTL